MRTLSVAVVLAAVSAATASISFWPLENCIGRPFPRFDFPVNECDPFDWRVVGSYSADLPFEDPVKMNVYYNFKDCKDGAPPNVTIARPGAPVCHNVPVDKIETPGAIEFVPVG